jgi:HAMP domain-containing protein
MILPKSIKQKLQWWVVVIFVLTGTAGWMGIWGLLYISRSSQSVTGEGVEQARRAGQLEADLAAVRRGESAWLAASTATERGEEGARWATALTSLRGSLERMRPAASAEQLRELRDAHTRAVTELRTTVRRVDAGEPFPAVRTSSFAAYDSALASLEAGTRLMTDRAFTAVSAQSSKLYGWIQSLQLGLFIVVALCQVFSAWAGWSLSRSVSGELNGLKESAERISMGDLASEVKVATTDAEIVALGAALDRLRVSLSKAMERLARKPGAARPHSPAAHGAEPAEG